MVFIQTEKSKNISNYILNNFNVMLLHLIKDFECLNFVIFNILFSYDELKQSVQWSCDDNHLIKKKE